MGKPLGLYADLYREPQSINVKLYLPIIPIGIVAYAFTLLWDNLCRNSCIHVLFFLTTPQKAKKTLAKKIQSKGKILITTDNYMAYS